MSYNKFEEEELLQKCLTKIINNRGVFENTIIVKIAQVMVYVEDVFEKAENVVLAGKSTHTIMICNVVED